ncbi:MAG: class I SAM-dependent methyltransferase [Stigonema ocellatum SAG 48.90 = DSM 106950]|nr:class I SAM-dependent methyltransferase [Stigonema ocellatum SAG 48.90 = DSM 106950]
MNYRERLYETYVSGNKQFLRDLLPNPQKQDARNIINLRHAIASWVKQVPRTGKVLDVACGSGNILNLLQVEEFTNLYGVDISLEQVQIARLQFPQVVCADAMEYLLSNPNKFCLVTAFDILEHFNKEEAIKFLEAIHSALLPGGRLILQLPNGDSPFAGGIVYGDLTHEVTYTTVSLKHILFACGFSEPQFQEHGPQPTSLKGVIRYGIWGILRQIIRLIHLVETGGPSTEVYTRVMRATVVKVG